MGFDERHVHQGRKTAVRFPLERVMSYQRAFERIFTLLGSEYVLLIVAVNQELTGSNTPARELLLAARAASCEGAVEAAKTGCRRVIRGPVIRYDLNGDLSAPRGVTDLVELKSSDIKTALAGRVIPPGTPLVVAFVGASSYSATRLGEGACVEQADLSLVVTGGYLVLDYAASDSGPPTRLSFLDVCEKQAPAPKRASKTRVTPVALVTGPKFLVGTEEIDDKKSLVYSIRVPETVARVSPKKIGVPVSEPVRAIRGARWAPVVPDTELRVTATRVPSVSVSQVSVVAGPEWENLVQETVERVLLKLIPEGKKVDIQLGDGLMASMWPELAHKISKDPAWNSVFTHQSVDPTPQKNYEAFETLGDKVLGACLAHYLIAEGGSRVDSNSMTDINKEILANERQAEMAVNMGLSNPRLIRSTVVVESSMHEDIFEAFFGCLFTVANRLVDRSNLGFPLCEALFKKVLAQSDPTLDVWSIGKDAPTTLDQLFIRLGWGNMIVIYNEETGVTTVKLTPDARTYLESIGPPLRPGAPLAVGPPILDIQRSKKAAAKLALTALKLGWGIDSKYASLMMRSRLMKDERYAVVQREALSVANKMGFKDIYVLRRPKHGSQLYAVMGVRPDDSEAQLHIYKYDSSDVEGSGLSSRITAYITALRGFIGSKR